MAAVSYQAVTELTKRSCSTFIDLYGSANKCYQCIRLCLGAFRISPVENLYIDAHKPSLGARLAILFLQYASKIK